MGHAHPLISAKAWALSNSKKGECREGKSLEDQFEVASMTKVCTAYTSCRIFEELGILDKEKLKNIYMHVSRKAAYITGTSAYL